jgi:RNA-directed DNA polymerase
MHGVEKSDPPIVARNPANKAASAAAEPGEPRGGTKEKAGLQSTVRTQSRAAVSQAQARLREAVTRNKEQKLTALLHHVNVDALRAGFLGLKRTAAPGVDQLTWERYAENLEANLADPAARTYPRQMAGCGRSASPPWRTRSSRRRWRCF